MKQFLLLVFLMVITFSAAQASGSDKSANDSAIAAGRIELRTKITQLNSNLSASSSSATSRQTADEVWNLMAKGMRQSMRAMDLEGGQRASTFPKLNARYLEMENAAHQFHQLKADPATNSSALMRYANEFLDQY